MSPRRIVTLAATLALLLLPWGSSRDAELGLQILQQCTPDGATPCIACHGIDGGGLPGTLLAVAAALMIDVAVIASAQTSNEAAPTFPPPTEGQYVHTPPSYDEIPGGPLGEATLRGWEVFNETRKFKGVYTYSDQTCASCHLGEGGVAFSEPVWPAVTTSPDYRDKYCRVNSIEDRASDCFACSMNGQAPEFASYNGALA